MTKRLSFISFFSFFCSLVSLSQTVEVDLFQNTATATTSQIGIRVRSTGANIQYLGVTFYILYQSANAAPLATTQNTGIGIDDSKLSTTYGWGTGSRFTNPAQVITPLDPGPAGGQLYDRRFVYGNSDDAGGANAITLTSAWDTLLFITLNTLQPVYPQGGYAYIQSTSEAAGTALSDLSFANVPLFSNSGDRALGLTLVPVIFTSYDVRCSDKGVILNWTTASEQNSDKFEIQRSANGIDWKTISNVSAAGNSNSASNYKYLDVNNGLSFYRIRQVDIDGRFTYTTIKQTDCKANLQDIFIYPVPAKDILNVVIKSEKSIRIQLLIFDMQGKMVKKMDAPIIAGNNNFRVNLSGLVSGDYLIRTNDARLEINQVFTIVK
jgi:Secretion system C-terminal sorting domain